MAIFQSGKVTLDKIRQIRNQKLAETDWLVTRFRDQKDAGQKPSLSQSQYLALLKYRQALRDLPATIKDLKKVTWPQPPKLA